MKLNLKIIKRHICVFCLIGLIIIVQNAWGDDTPDAISKVLCDVVTTLQGAIGKAIAIIAIIVLGIGLFMGKLSWPLALATAIGIGIIFGAGTIITWLFPAGSSGCGS